MTLLISDANVLIDMETGQALDLMFRLPQRFAVPNILYIEELVEQHGHLPGLGLAVLNVQETFVLEAYRLGTVYRKPSHNDLLALALAKQEACPILTGDRFLREAAHLEKVNCVGTLWLMEQLLQTRLLNYHDMEITYAKMLSGGRRLPREEIESQLLRLKP